MTIFRATRTAAVLAVAIPTLSISAAAQTPTPQPSPPANEASPSSSPQTSPEQSTSAPSIAKPEKAPAAQVEKPAPDKAKEAATAPDTTKQIPQATGPKAADIPVGAAVFGSDGKRLGKVEAVKSASGGDVDEIKIHVGGLFGFFGKSVMVPASKITKSGTSVQLTLSSSEVDNLPSADQRG